MFCCKILQGKFGVRAWKEPERKRTFFPSHSIHPSRLQIKLFVAKTSLIFMGKAKWKITDHLIVKLLQEKLPKRQPAAGSRELIKCRQVYVACLIMSMLRSAARMNGLKSPKFRFEPKTQQGKIRAQNTAGEILKGQLGARCSLHSITAAFMHVFPSLSAWAARKMLLVHVHVWVYVCVRACVCTQLWLHRCRERTACAPTPRMAETKWTCSKSSCYVQHIGDSS